MRYRTLENPRVVGLISGTSADGVDAVLVSLGEGSVKVHRHLTMPLPGELREGLFRAFEDEATVREVAVLDVQVGELFARAALEVMGEERADLVASHGQTVAHLPRQAATLQIGQPAVIAERTGCLVAAEFRYKDMAAGGEGAPMVPFFDIWLLHSEKVDRVALNIGGIANVTWIPRSGEPAGYDTGPGNALSDAIVERHNGRSYDAGGELAARGRVLPELLEELLAHDYFRQPAPKSTGREEFGRPMAERLWGRGEPADLARTALALTAETIAREVLRLTDGPVELVGAGGGVENPVLMEELRRRLPERVRLRRFDEFGVPAEVREATAFALLGHRTAHGLPSNVPSVTGARRATVLGALVYPG